MEGSLDLRSFVVPVVRYNEGIVAGVLGTAFIALFRDTRVVVTAGHVLDTASKNRWDFGVTYTLTDGELHFGSPSSYVRSARHDIAAIPLNDFVLGLPEGGLEFGSHVYPVDTDVCTFEYSQSSLFRLPGEKDPALALTPYFHKGHAMRRYFEPPLDPAGESQMELSFPALQGASGAPVLNLNDNSVVGMLVANRERHLLPAQVVTIERDDGAIEEASYFLPMGVALDVRCILDFLENEDPFERLVKIDYR